MEVVLWVPFNINLSKNQLWKRARNGHTYIRPEAKAAQDMVWLRTLDAVTRSQARFEKDKVYVEIFVERPDRRSDPINFIDSICDGVKKAIGVDDNWFALLGVDWKIVKKDPRIFIRIYQGPKPWCELFR